jgi:copper chaperone
MEETFRVPDVHCEHCDHAIRGALEVLGGVERAKVDLESKEVTVTYDDAKVAREQLIVTIEDEGYPVGRSSSQGLSVDMGRPPT